MRDYKKTDPEFIERFEHFAYDEVVNEEGQQLDDVTRHMAITATLLGCQGSMNSAWKSPGLWTPVSLLLC